MNVYLHLLYNIFMQVTFRGYIPKDIPLAYKSYQSKKNTVAILGSSKSSDKIMNYLNMCSNVVKGLMQSDKNIVHGCGTTGIMGAAHYAGVKYSAKNNEGKPKQNLGIVTDVLWGNEDTENCIMLTSAKNESDRIDKFAEVADTILVFPGSVTTLQEATTLIQKNYYGNKEDKKKIILVGKEYFKGLDEQYQTLYKNGLITCKPDELYKIVDSEEEIKALTE